MKKLISILLIIALIGCASNSSPSRSSLTPTTSEYLITLGGGFMVNAGEVKYAMTYKATKEFPQGVKLKVSFENPEDVNAPYVSSIKPEENKSGNILIRSVGFKSIKNKKIYKVTIEVVLNNLTISTHIQHIQFNMPQAIVTKLGIKLL